MIKIYIQAYGIPETINDAIEDIYKNTKAKVISPDGETKLIDILAGVVQGDTFAAYLFIITLDYCQRNAVCGKGKSFVLPSNTTKPSKLLALKW